MISIQKQICLLTDFHFKEFSEYLLNVNADLPHKLINTIRGSKIVHESDELCSKIYGDSEEKTKKKFLQLTHHTFKLSVYLSRNYPNYLKHNLLLIEELLSKGNKNRANEIADWLNDVAEKIEDYTTLIELNKFLAQQCFITESKDAAKYHKKIEEYAELEGIKNSIYLYLREHLFFKGKDSISKLQAKKDLEFFNQYVSHKSDAINILARYGKFYELSFLSHPDFFKPETAEELNILERDFLKNAHVCFHYLDDIYFKILGLKLQLTLNNENADQMFSEIKKMNSISSFLKYWQTYINIPEIFSLSIQASYFLSSYGFYFKTDYQTNLPNDVAEHIKYLKLKIEQELAKDIWDNGEYIIKLINLKCYYAAVLLSGNESDKNKSIKLIEDTLISYQQIPFQKFLDSMFIILIIGYFSTQQYEKVIVSYKRYKKITSEQIVVKENDLTIDAYYYAAQYLTNRRKQYIEKLKFTYNECNNFEHVQKLIKEIVNYFSIPAKL